jgi:hypothetical protein
MAPTTLEGWFTHPKVRFEDGRQGGNPEDGVLVFGDRAGPECRLANLTHEMGHMVEINHNRKWWFGGWGLTTRDVWCYDRYCEQPHSDTCVRREIRTIAIQWMIQDQLGSSTSAEDAFSTVGALRFLTDEFEYWIRRRKILRTPFDKKRFASKKRMMRDVVRHKNTLTIEGIWQEWQTKCKVLENVLY